MINHFCRSGGMADATDSKSVVGDNVWVQVPPSAPKKNVSNDLRSFFYKIFYNPCAFFYFVV